VEMIAVLFGATITLALVSGFWLAIYAMKHPLGLFGIFLHDAEMSESDRRRALAVIDWASKHPIEAIKRVKFDAHAETPAGTYLGKCACGCGLDIHWDGGPGRKPKYINKRHVDYARGKRRSPFTDDEIAEAERLLSGQAEP